MEHGGANYSFLGPDMASRIIRQRKSQADPAATSDMASSASMTNGSHPAGQVRHHGAIQVLRVLSFGTYFLVACCTINATQFLGAPLYLINQDYYYAYMSWTKQSFGLLLTTLCQWWSPTTIRISGDESVKGQLRRTDSGRLECDFPDRIIILANHQLYTDWLYLWWIAYTNRMHGHIYIILKESLKYLPIIGPGMMFYGFIFLARNWTKDKPRFAHRLQKLKSQHTGPLSGSGYLDPMWLMMFPEGTNLSNNGRARSAKWAEKQGYPDLRHQLLPRSTGLLFCLQEVKGTVDWVYDCTVAYEGIRRGQFGQDIFTLRSSFVQGRPPKSVNMYWRRFAMSSIPLDDPEAFDLWLRQRWIEKDELLELYLETGRFPANEGDDLPEKPSLNNGGFIETEVRQAHWWEFSQIFVTLATIALLANIGRQLWQLVLRNTA